MTTIILREPIAFDEKTFLAAMKRSKALHHPWVQTPLTSQEFKDYLERSRQPNQKSFIVSNRNNSIIGVFNLNEIVRGCFQNAYLGFYTSVDYIGQGYMSIGLKLIIKKAFTELQLHRLEANIQPENTRSINLVESNGFRKEGFSSRYLKINDKWCDHERWAITVEDWKEL